MDTTPLIMAAWISHFEGCKVIIENKQREIADFADNSFKQLFEMALYIQRKEEFHTAYWK